MWVTNLVWLAATLPNVEHKITIEDFKSMITSLVNPKILESTYADKLQLKITVQLNDVYVPNYAIAQVFRSIARKNFLQAHLSIPTTG